VARFKDLLSLVEMVPLVVRVAILAALLLVVVPLELHRLPAIRAVGWEAPLSLEISPAIRLLVSRFVNLRLLHRLPDLLELHRLL
jgi:hypothetical protein